MDLDRLVPNSSATATLSTCIWQRATDIARIAKNWTYRARRAPTSQVIRIFGFHAVRLAPVALPRRMREARHVQTLSLSGSCS